MPFPLAIGLGASRALGFLKRVPRWAWIALAVIAILLLGSCVHSRKVKAFGKERYAAGVAYEQARIEKKALALKAKIDTISGKISIALKERHDEQARIITRNADGIRLRGPGLAACAGSPRVPGGSGRSVPAGGGAVPPTTGLPDQDRIALPFAYAVDQAERCDLNRQEVLIWRDWHKQQSEAWKNLEKDN